MFTTPAAGEIFSLSVILAASYGIGALFKSRQPLVKFAFGTAILSFIAWCIPELSGKAMCCFFSILLTLSALAGIYALFYDIPHWRMFFIPAAALYLFFLGSYLIFPYSWDECVYQTALLKHYIEAGNHAALPDNPFSFFPSLPHSLMRLGMEITGGGIRLPRMFSGAVMVIVLAGIIQNARRCGGKNSLLFIAAAILSPVTLVLARANYAEQFILFFAAAGILSLEENRKNPIKCAMMTALFAAAAFSVKLTGAGIAAVLGMLYLTMYKKNRFIYGCIAGTAVFIIFSLPFFLRAFLAKGNPFFPFCDWLFSDELARITVSHHHHLLGSYRYGTGIVSGILYGWLFTAADPNIYDGISTGWQFPVMAALNVILAVHLFKCGSIRRKTAALLLACVWGLYIFWAITSQQSRFMLPILMLNAVLCAFMSKGTSKKCAFFLGIAVLLAAWFTNPANHLKHFVIAWKTAPKISADPERFLAAATRDPGYFEAVNFLKTTPAESRVLLLLNERRTLYMPRKAVIGEPFFQELNTPLPPDAQTLWQNIRKYDYILVSSANKNPDAQESTANELIKAAGMVSLLRDEGKIHLVFSDKSGEYFIFRCGETATGTAL